MEVEEFHARTWTPGEIVWVSTGSGGKNLCGKLISVFKDTVKLRMKAKEDATTEWSDTDFRVFHCRQIRKDENEKPPPIFPKMEQAKATRHAKSKLEPTANRRVRCVETGKEYTILEAGELANVFWQSVYSSIRRGTTAGGYHFETVGWEIKKRGLGGKPAPVICIETGMVFPTTDAAAKCAKVSNQTIRRVCESGRALYGYHFKRI